MTAYRFDQIAANITVRVEPSDTDLERYVGLEHLDPESLKLRKWGSPSDVIGQKLKFWKGDIIYGKRRAYQRKLAVADFDGICSAHAMVLRAKPEVCLPEFLPFFLQSDLFHNRALEISVGSLSPTINWTTLAKQEFPLPPVDEQRRIADLLWAADDMIDTKKLLLENLRVLRQSLINDVVPNPEAETENVFLLKEICEMQNGKGFPSSDYMDDGVRLLRPGNLESNGYLSWKAKSTKCLPPKYLDIAPAYLIKPGDVVMNLTAQSLEEGFIGRVCLARSGDESLLNQRISRFKCDPKLRPEYLYRCFQTKRFRQTAESRCEGTKVKHMYWHHIADFKVVVPDLKKQDEVIEKCRAVDKAIFSSLSDIENSYALKKKLLASSLG